MTAELAALGWLFLVVWFGAIVPIVPTGAAVSGAAALAFHEHPFTIGFVVAAGAALANVPALPADQPVCALAPDQPVTLGAADQPVLARLAEQDVLAALTEEPIVAGPTAEAIAAAPAPGDVVAAEEQEAIGASRSE